MKKRIGSTMVVAAFLAAICLPAASSAAVLSGLYETMPTGEGRSIAVAMFYAAPDYTVSSHRMRLSSGASMKVHGTFFVNGSVWGTFTQTCKSTENTYYYWSPRPHAYNGYTLYDLDWNSDGDYEIEDLYVLNF